MIEFLSNIAEATIQASTVFYIVLWVVLLAVNYAYYSK